MISFLAVVVVVDMITGDVVLTAMIGQIMSAIVSSILFKKCWENLPARDKLKEVPPGYSKFLVGFFKAYLTMIRVYYCFPEFFKFELGFAIFDSGTSALISLFIVYLNEQLCMSSTTVFSLFCLIFAIPGAKLSLKTAKKWGAQKALVFWLLYWVGVVLIFALMCSTPDHQTLAYVVGILAGIGEWIARARALL